MKLGTFYGSGLNWTCRDAATLGNIAAGSKDGVIVWEILWIPLTPAATLVAA